MNMEEVTIPDNEEEDAEEDDEDEADEEVEEDDLGMLSSKDVVAARLRSLFWSLIACRVSFTSPSLLTYESFMCSATLSLEARKSPAFSPESQHTEQYTRADSKALDAFGVAESSNSWSKNKSRKAAVVEITFVGWSMVKQPAGTPSWAMRDLLTFPH